MPQRFSTLAEAESYIRRYSPHMEIGEAYTLERMKLLMKRLGDPQNDIPAIHIAGTSGKTSTAYYVRALLEAYGKRTGLTASPHIVSVTERLQLDGQPVSDRQFLEYLDEFIDVLETLGSVNATYFELLMAFAFWVFKKEQVDYMIVEVGLGGLLDATNVINRPDKINVITPIGLDHTHVLGSTTTEIAAQKAGIITDNSIVFTAKQDPDVAAVLTQAIEEHNAQIHVTSLMNNSAGGVPVFQQSNFSLARDVVEYIRVRDALPDVTEETLQSCIVQSPPGRFETYRLANGTTIIIDGAHNPQKLEAFIQSLSAARATDAEWLVGFASASDSKIEECLKVINKAHPARVTFTQFNIDQDIRYKKSVPVHDLQQKAYTIGIQGDARQDALDTITRLIEKPATTIIVTGSLYLVANVRPLLIERSN